VLGVSEAYLCVSPVSISINQVPDRPQTHLEEDVLVKVSKNLTFILSDIDLVFFFYKGQV
jgi:hypothetical protein